MSSPVHHDKDLDVGLIYAPPWAREQSRRPAMPTAGATLQWPPPARRFGEVDVKPAEGGTPFTGDLAILELKRQLALDPQMVPEPPRAYTTASPTWLAVRICAALAAAGVIAYVAAAMPLPSMTRPAHDPATAALPVAPIFINRKNEDRLPDGATRPRLVIKDQRGAMNEPLRAGISLEGDPAGAIVTLAGLAPNTRLSAGSPMGANAWRLPARELGTLLVQAPPTFAGTMEVTVDLRAADGQIADSQVLHLEWIDNAEAKNGAVPLSRPSDRNDAEARTLRLEPDEMAKLVMRSEEALKNGDLSSARLLLRRAAEAGSAPAAFALGATYDPRVINQLGTIGAVADAAQARAWYEKAVELGSLDASQRLEQLAQTAR